MLKYTKKTGWKVEESSTLVKSESIQSLQHYTAVSWSIAFWFGKLVLTLGLKSFNLRVKK